MNIGESPPRSELITQETIAIWNDKGYKVEFYGKELKVIVLGESHGYKDIMHKQLELINEVKPDFVLHEFGAAWIYDPHTDEFKPQPNRKFNRWDINPQSIIIPVGLVSASKKLGFKIIGCDLTEAEISFAARQIARENPSQYEYDEEYDLLSKPDAPYWIFTNQSKKVMPRRDEKMAEMILTYQAKTEKPLLTILGGVHAENIHNGKLIQEKGFGYAFVDQTTGKRNIS